MVAAYLLDPTAGKYSLKYLAKKFLNKEMIEFSELVGEKKEYQNFSELPLDLAVDYAGSDADSTFSLFELFQKELAERSLADLAERVEMPLVPVLAEMETTGIRVDLALLQEMAKEIDATLKKLEKDLFCLAGEVFNLNSPKQLGKILFDKLQLPVIKKTKTGPSTDAEVLEELAARKFEIAEKLLDYRQLNKLKNTYVDVLPTLINPKSGRLHSSFNQTSTATGRLSSSEPNLQNIPARGVWGEKLRSAFIPGETGSQLISADYSQVELRILAHLSNDSALLEAFRLDQDVHQTTADELGISRNFAKTINFGVIYGMSDFGLGKALGIKRTEAAEYITRYFQRYPGIKEFIDRTMEQARKDGGVTTLLGRFRPLPDINNPNAGLRAAAERTAINTPVQGTAADLIKLAMVNIDQELKKNKLQARLLLQVHDELVLECSVAELTEVINLVGKEMENALALKVPLKVDIRSGNHWGKKS
jgi:DNA polymerase-1